MTNSKSNRLLPTDQYITLAAATVKTFGYTLCACANTSIHGQNTHLALLFSLLSTVDKLFRF